MTDLLIYSKLKKDIKSGKTTMFPFHRTTYMILTYKLYTFFHLISLLLFYCNPFKYVCNNDINMRNNYATYYRIKSTTGNINVIRRTSVIV